MRRILKPGGHLGLYVCDSFVKNKGFFPIGFELFAIMRESFVPVDIVAVARHNKTLEMGNYRRAALDGNFFLRGFNYLFIMRKPSRAEKTPGQGKGADTRLDKSGGGSRGKRRAH